MSLTEYMGGGYANKGGGGQVSFILTQIKCSDPTHPTPLPGDKYLTVPTKQTNKKHSKDSRTVFIRVKLLALPHLQSMFTISEPLTIVLASVLA